MRRTIWPKKSNHEIMTIVLIYAIGLILVAGIWYLLGF